MNKDGGLKTGRVALLIFVLLLAGGALLFKASRRIDSALVVVHHVFEPQPEEVMTQDVVPEKAVAPEQVETAVGAEVPPVREETRAEAAPEPKVKEEVLEPEMPVPTVSEPAAKERNPAIGALPSRVTQEQRPVAQSPPFNPEPAVHPDSRKGNSELSVAPDRYLELLQSWNTSGSKEEGNTPIPLRVENLRDSYPLFQMKVVAVNGRGQLFDLADSSRLASAALDDYAPTVFAVDHPWQQWGEALKRAGFRPDEPVQVRYAMYPFVKNAIYARSRQAFEWCQAQGLLAADILPEQVDVLGRTYVINRQGGGRFGVFVPVSLDTPDGRTIAVPPDVFAGQKDVAALRMARIF